jgi:DNA-binding GntR family transcriptional regulator
MSGELAAQRVTDAELAEIRAMHYEMLAAHTRRDLSAYYRINATIHRAINAAAKNSVLTTTYNQVNARLQALRFRSNQDEGKWQRAVKEHEQMIDALAARDSARMRKILVTHLNNKRDVVVEQLRAAATPASAVTPAARPAASPARASPRTSPAQPAARAAPRSKSTAAKPASAPRAAKARA